jgi:hypothetical protein
VNPLTQWQSRVRTPDDLVAFVNDIGFCTISPIEGLPTFPNQDQAMGVDDSLGRTWFWKDDLHIEKRLYYSRVLRRQPGYISMEWLPVFIATNGRPADELIYSGKMTAGAREIYELIERRGPISSHDIGHAVSAGARRSRATSLIELERQFVVAKVGLSGRERGTYGYVWDLAEKWVGWAFEEADRIGEVPAARRIVLRLRDLGLQPSPELLSKLLGWEPRLALAGLQG